MLSCRWRNGLLGAASLAAVRSTGASSAGVAWTTASVTGAYRAGARTATGWGRSRRSVERPQSEWRSSKRHKKGKTQENSSEHGGISRLKCEYDKHEVQRDDLFPPHTHDGLPLIVTDRRSIKADEVRAGKDRRNER